MGLALVVCSVLVLMEAHTTPAVQSSSHKNLQQLSLEEAAFQSSSFHNILTSDRSVEAASTSRENCLGVLRCSCQ